MKKKTCICISIILFSVSLYSFDFSFKWNSNLLRDEKSCAINSGIMLALFMFLAIILIFKTTARIENAYRTSIIILWAFFVFEIYDQRIDIISDFVFPLIVLVGSVIIIIMALFKKEGCEIDEDEVFTDCQNEIHMRKYRDLFYTLPFCFSRAINEDEYIEWFDELCYSDEAENMLCVEFIKRFNISKDEFTHLNTEYADYLKREIGASPCINPKKYPEQEKSEIFNADIIYSFDNDIIRQYYLKPIYEYSNKSDYEVASKSSNVL